MKTQKSFIAIVLLCCSVCAFAQESWDVSLRSIFDGERRIYYTDIEDAETKILEYYAEKRGVSEDEYGPMLPYQMFAELILHDSRAFDYDFSRFLEASEEDRGTVRALRIIESPDRKLRLYTWDADGGTMTNYSGITSITAGGSVFSYSTFPDEDTGMNYTDDFPDIASGAYAIEQLTDANGETIYAVYSHSSGSNMMQHLCVNMYRIRGHFIECALVFETEDGMASSISVYYAPYGRYYMDLECNNGKFLLPLTRENDHNSGYGDLFTGRCVSYKWNGAYFSNNGFVYPLDNDLYPTLKNYQSYVGQFEFDKWIVRVDKMSNGAFRYASWKRPKTTSDVPDMILNRGAEEVIEEACFRYVFRNNEYSYIILCNFFELSAELVVKRNSQVLMRIESIEVIE